MGLVAIAALDKVVWIFFIVGAHFQACTCTVQSFSWMEDTAAAGIICQNDAIREALASSVIKCGVVCTKDAGCESFTFVDTMDTMSPNCYLMNVDPSLMGNCVSQLAARHFIRVQTSLQCQPYDTEYHTFKFPDGSHFSYRMSSGTTDRDSAMTDCTDSGGSLLKIPTVTKLNYIQQLFSTCTGLPPGRYYFIDGSNLLDSIFKWTDDTPIIMNETFWVPGQPGSPSTQNCIVMDSSDIWRFHDAHCTSKYQYICEK